MDEFDFSGVKVPYVSIDNPKELFTQFPKAKEALRQWFIERNLREGIEKSIAEEAINDFFLEIIVRATPRALYDFFDEHKVFLVVDYVYGDDANSWYYIIHGEQR